MYHVFRPSSWSHMGFLKLAPTIPSGFTKRPWRVPAFLQYRSPASESLKISVAPHEPANPFSIQPHTTRNGRSPVSKRAEARDFPAFASGPVSQRAVDRWILVGLWIVHQSFVGAAVRSWSWWTTTSILQLVLIKRRAKVGLEMIFCCC